MSILSFPRIYFNGFMSWDPCTFNNNDWQNFQTFDAVNAALNWDFLKTQGPQPGGINRDNFTTRFRPWAITLQEDNNPEDAPPGNRIPAEWNMFGSHNVALVNYNDKKTAISGGDLAYGKETPGDDPLLGTPISISNNGACLVDVNPASFWSSQVFWGTSQNNDFTLGNTDCGLSGPRNFRMHSRWLNLKRIYSATSELIQPAASVSACFQTCIPTSQVKFMNGLPGSNTYSPLIEALQNASGQPGAIGVMIRFNAYVNLYFQNGIFNNTTQQPRNYEELAAALADAWAAFNKNGDTSKFFSNQCYSHVIGAVGIWKSGELASVPVGHFLAPTQNSVLPANPQKNSSPVSLGPLVAEVDFNDQLISLDLNSTIPELAVPGTNNSDLAKVDIGDIVVGILDPAGIFTPLTPAINYTGYQRSAYEAKAGILDIPFDNSSAAAKSFSLGASLAIQMQGITTLAEQNAGYSVQTDQRGIYIDESETKTFQLAVYYKGSKAPEGTCVLVAKYDAGLNLIITSQPQLVNFISGEIQDISTPAGTTSVTVTSTDENGKASVAILSQSPGFPVLAFYPFAQGQPIPVPPPVLIGPPTAVSNNQKITNAFYTTVRVLPFDNNVPQDFIDLWNSTLDPEKVWRFIYDEVLYVYDMIFNVMLKYFNMGNRTDVEKNAPYIKKRITADMALENPGAMPVTRDMSNGKRIALLLWCYLAINNYSPKVIDRQVLQES